VVGENPPNSYIRGYEYFQTLQYNLGATQVLGASDNPFGADQLILIGEVGATHVLNLPSWDSYRSTGRAPTLPQPRVAEWHRPAKNGSARACSTNPSCNVGADGLRLQPDAAGRRLRRFVLVGLSHRRPVSNTKACCQASRFQPQIILSHDVKGTAPGRVRISCRAAKSALITIETRYKESLSFTLGYGWFTGAGEHNVLRDRDFAQAFAKYQF